MLKMLLLVLLSVSDVFDNYSKVRHIKNLSVLALKASEIQRFSSHPFMSPRAALLSLFSLFFWPTWTLFHRCSKHTRFSFEEEKVDLKRTRVIVRLKTLPHLAYSGTGGPATDAVIREPLEQGCPRSAESVDLSGAFLSGINWSLRGKYWLYCIPSMCVHFLWVHILWCFINRASNAPLDKAREHWAGRHPPVQLLLLCMRIKPELYEVLYNGAVKGQSRWGT